MMRGTVWCPICPSRTIWGNDYLTPNFWAGRGSETVGRRGPGTSPKVSPIIRGTCSAQLSSKLILPKMLPWTPPPPLKKRNFELGLRSRWKPVLLRPRKYSGSSLNSVPVLSEEMEALVTFCHFLSHVQGKENIFYNFSRSRC